MKKQMIARESVLIFAVVMIVSAIGLRAEPQDHPKQPNIILLFSDDAGYADFGFQGSTRFKTPCLDQLAAQGMRCTSAYVTAAVCGPSRAGLITGKYQQRFGFHDNNVPSFVTDEGLQGDDIGLPLDQKTIADYLKQQGYTCAVIGKWHLGNADRFHPLKRGFDEFYGFRYGSRSYFPYKVFNKKTTNRELERNFRNFQEHEGYLTDVLAQEACAFIERNRERPFFLYLAFNAVHMPLDTLKEDMQQFPELKGDDKKIAAMTLSLDRACGVVLDKLEELGLADNTLVVFTDDNGGTPYSCNDPLSGVKGTHLEGGVRVPFVIKWPGHIPADGVYENPVSTLDLLPTFYEVAGGNAATLEDIDGKNLIPFLNGTETDRPHQTLYWKEGNFSAIHDGDWKLIQLPDRPAQLYNLAQDISEVYDLAAQEPERAEALNTKLRKWRGTLAKPLWFLQPRVEGYLIEFFDKYKKKPESTK